MSDQRGGADIRSEGGFTLIEMLVALSVLALILSMLPDALRFAQRSRETAAHIDRTEELASAKSFLRRSLSEAMPLYARSPAGGVAAAFAGAETAIAYVAPSSAGPTGGGLYRYALSVAPDEGGRLMLILASQPFRLGGAADGAAPPRPAETRRLAGGLAAVSLRYFGKPNRTDERAAWSSRWQRTDALPDAVEIMLDRGERTGGTPHDTVLVELKLKDAAR